MEKDISEDYTMISNYTCNIF